MTAAAPDRRSLPWRALLFVPGDEPRKLEKAAAAGADALIVDLEDAVRPGAKALARERGIEFAAEAGEGPVRIVRVNDPLGEEGERDLAAIAAAPGELRVMVPKARAAAVEAALEVAPEIVALVETPAGLLEAAALARLEGVVALALGTVATASAGPLPVNPGVKNAPVGQVTDVRWRGRGFGPGAAIVGGLAAGALIGSAVAAQPYGGYYAEPGYAYEPGYVYDAPAPYYGNYGYNGGWGKCYTDEGYGRFWPCGAGKD